MQKFNEDVFVDVFDVKLPDDSSCLLLMTIDDASGYAVAVPASGRSKISTDAAIEGFSRGWLCWAGPPVEVQFIANAFSCSMGELRGADGSSADSDSG